MRVKSKKYAGVYLNHLEGGDVSYSVTYKNEHSKLIRFTVGKKSNGISEKFCYNKRAELINQVKHGIDPLAHKKKKVVVTLDEVFVLYKEAKKTISRDLTKTEQKYKSNIFKVFGTADLNSITTDKIIKFRQSLIDKKLAGSTINSNISFIGTLFNFAIEEGMFTGINPTKTKKLKSMKLDNARERYLSLDEITTLYKAVAHDEELTLFVKIALITGARLEAILNIQKKDVKLEDGTVTLKDIKSDETYQGFLSDELITTLQDYLRDLYPNSYLIGGLVTKKPTRTITRHLKQILDDNFNVGLDVSDTKNRAVIHTLRHTFASQLAIRGVPIFTIKELMNHSDINMTMRYAKLSPDNGRDAVRGLYR